MEHGNGSGRIGRAAEDRALALLLTSGLQLVERNFRCRLGEIDLVMRDRGTVVFVEVRLRRSARHGTAAESIDARKLRRLQSAALMWQRWRGFDGPLRLDVATLDGGTPEDARIEWIRGAG